MPEINFQIQWPDGTKQNCYSPSLIVKKYFTPGETYELTEFVEKSRTALNIASDRVKEAYGFYKPGEIYLVYLKHGGNFTLNLQNEAGTFGIIWYNPRTGAKHNTEAKITAGRTVKIGPPPEKDKNDWLAVIRKVE